MNDSTFAHFSGCFSIILCLNATFTTYWKQLLSWFCGFIVSLLLLILSAESMYDPPHLRLILGMIHHIRGLSYVWSTTSEAYLIALVMQSIDMSKHKTTTFYRFFQTFLIFFQKRITMFSNDSESLIIIFMLSSLVCIVCFSLLSADYMNLGLIASWWHEFRFDSQLNFSFVRFFKTIYHIE